MLLMKVFSNQKDITAMLSEQGASHIMTIAAGSDSVIMTFTVEQLLQISEAIEWYLFRKENPAATLEECLEELG